MSKMSLSNAFLKINRFLSFKIMMLNGLSRIILGQIARNSKIRLQNLVCK